MGQTVNLLSFDFGGSNPSLPTNNTAEVAQLIEHQPSKLRVASLSLVFRSKISFTDCDDGHSRFFLCPLAGVMQKNEAGRLVAPRLVIGEKPELVFSREMAAVQLVRFSFSLRFLRMLR